MMERGLGPNVIGVSGWVAGTAYASAGTSPVKGVAREFYRPYHWHSDRAERHSEARTMTPLS